MQEMDVISEENSFVERLIRVHNHINDYISLLQERIRTEGNILISKEWVDLLYNDKIDLAQGKTVVPKIKHTSLLWDVLSGQITALRLACELGMPFQYLQQNEGEVVARIYPKKGFEQTNSGYNMKALGWHTDDSILTREFRAHWIALFGFSNPHDVPTYISRLDKILNVLSLQYIKILSQPLYCLKMPTSFGNQDIWSAPTPLMYLQQNTDLMEIAVATYHAQPADVNNKKAKEALNALICAAEHVKEEIILKPGDWIIFNNNRVLHSRGEIQHQERLIFRTYIRPNLHALIKRTGDKGYVFNLEKLIDNYNNNLIIH